MDKKQQTTIQVSKDTKAKLVKLGSKGDTYDAIINILLKNAQHPMSGS